MDKDLLKIKKEIGNTSLVAVTKTRSIDEIKRSLEDGIKIIGENRIQEAEEKYIVLKEYLTQNKVEFHFIGHLQKNKAKKAVLMFDLIQTVDSIELAKEIDKRALELGKIQKILVQINIGDEPQKSGINPKELMLFLKELRSFKNLKAKGLMCIAPDFKDKEMTRPYFKKMKRLFDESGLDILSMGMSEDYIVAVEEGSNMVRLGRILFGERDNL